MQKIRVVFPNLQNAGDMLNAVLLHKMFNIRIIRSKVYDADMMAIGGALSGLQYSIGFPRCVCQDILGRVFEHKILHVWGSGFLYNNNEKPFYRTNINFCALRGELSRLKASKLVGRNITVPLADPGLLASILLEKKCIKKYEIGVIPHFSQQKEAGYRKLLEAFPKALFINIKKPPIDVIHDIAECEFIISSSLHGLIFADSLAIPSLSVTGETPLLGGDFKYRDYYSSFGEDYLPWDILKSIPTVNNIVDQYKIKNNLVEEKKQQLIKSFPFHKW